MLLSLTDLFAENSISSYYCAHCRQEQSPETTALLRCSRCRVVHYCSRECQKSNFPLHKKCCKQIDKCRTQLLPKEEGNSNIGGGAAATSSTSSSMDSQYLLARTILELAYRSTDTIERGKTIYQCALLEYYKLMREDPFYIGACESVVLLLALLGYDDQCMGLIQFMLHPPRYYEEGGDAGNETTTREEAIRDYTLRCSEQDSDVWIYEVPPGRENISFSFDECNTIRDRIPKQWCPNLFLVPLLLIKMRQQSRITVQAQANRQPGSDKLREEIVNLGRQVEYEAHFLLPVLHSFFPDSRQQWGMEEVCSLLAADDYTELQGDEINDNDLEDDDDFYDRPYQPNIWEQHCDTFWMMLKDCYAFTPGILDVVEQTIEDMEVMGKPAIPENPDEPTCAETMEFIDYMAEKQQRQRNNNNY